MFVVVLTPLAESQNDGIIHKHNNCRRREQKQNRTEKCVINLLLRPNSTTIAWVREWLVLFGCHLPLELVFDGTRAPVITMRMAIHSNEMLLMQRNMIAV